MRKEREERKEGGQPLITGYGTRIFVAPLVFTSDRIDVGTSIVLYFYWVFTAFYCFDLLGMYGVMIFYLHIYNITID